MHRADGMWLYAFDLGKDKKGKRRRRYIYASSRGALMRKIQDMRARGGGSIRPRAAGTVAEWVQRWLRDDIQLNRSRNTYSLYETMWRVHAAPFVGGISLERFDVEHVEALYAQLRKGGAGVNVVHRVGVVLHRAFQVAIRRRVYHRANPFALVEKPTPRPQERRVLTAGEARVFLEAARHDRYEALWVLLLTTGLRMGEALALEWRDIDFDANALAVRQAVVEAGAPPEVTAPKTKGSRRRVELGAIAMEALRRREAAAKGERHESSFVFTTSGGTLLQRSNVRRRHFEPVCRAAGVRGLTPHGLRHTMTSLALAEGIPAKVVSERLGHSTTKLTQDRYAHVLPGLQRSAADRLDALLGPSQPRS